MTRTSSTQQRIAALVGAQGGSYDREHRPLSSEGLAPRLVTIADPTSVASEPCRILLTNLIYSLVDTPPKVIVLTNPGPGEGKSITCAQPVSKHERCLGEDFTEAHKKCRPNSMWRQ